MEIQRLGPFTNLPLDSAPAAEGETAVKGARRGDAALKPEEPAPVAGNEPAGEAVDSRRAEPRLEAESLKADLFARCDQASTDHAAHGPQADTESSLIADVSDYLRRHPGAEDSLEGVDSWRDFGEMAELDARANAVAIDRLVIQGEGWTRDEGTTESSGSSEEAGGENRVDDPDRG